MNHLKKRLTSLYLQKEQIEQEILALEAQLNDNKELSKEEKIELFKTLFIPRQDVFARLWVSQDKTKQRFYPVSATFKKDDYLPLTNLEIEQHLRGQQLLASYVIDENNRSTYVVFKLLRGDIETFFVKLQALGISACLQIDSKSDYLAWIFFEHAIQAKNAKAFGQYLLRYCNISSKIYPSTEFSNRSNLGDCIELPLHLEYRKEQKTVFINSKNYTPIAHQWDYLQQIKKVPVALIEKLVKSDSISSFDEDVLEQIAFPTHTLSIYIYDWLYIPTLHLSASLLTHLKSLACFDNPQIKILLALRRPLYNTPKIIRNYEEDEKYLKLPRGLRYEVIALFEKNGVSYECLDKTFFKSAAFDKITFTLREEQQDAIEAINTLDFSICVAPPGFGKTLIGAKMIELRQANTLVIVNKNMLLDQWRERFVDYFQMNKKNIGYLGKGKNRLNGILDVATMQSLKNSPEIIKEYAFVIVDECHHIPAVTFEQIIKEFHGKYLLGLSATPNRKDGFEPILFQQLGPIAYEYKKKRTITHQLKLVPTQFTSSLENYAQIINELCNDEERNTLILAQIKQNIDRKILVLTDRIEHINNLEKYLIRDNINYVTIHGSLSKKEQNERIGQVQDAQLILATTSFFGEGIDFPHLNTIIFATPISYYGRLVQYLGRIGRDGQPCLAIDLLDSKNPILNAAYKKRALGYKQMHYKVM